MPYFGVPPHQDMGKEAGENNDDKVHTDVQEHVHTLDRHRRRLDGDLVALGDGKVLRRFKGLAQKKEGRSERRIGLCEMWFV